MSSFCASWYALTLRGSFRKAASSTLPARRALTSSGFVVASGGCSGGRARAGASMSSMAGDIFCCQALVMRLRVSIYASRRAFGQ